MSPHIFLSLLQSPHPCLSPQASGLSAGSGFSAKSGCLERNIVRSRGLRKVLIFRCLSNLSKNVSQVLAQLFGVQLQEGPAACLAEDAHPFRTPALRTRPHQTHRPGVVHGLEVPHPAQPGGWGSGGGWGVGEGRATDLFCHHHCLNSHGKNMPPNSDCSKCGESSAFSHDGRHIWDHLVFQADAQFISL